MQRCSDFFQVHQIWLYLTAVSAGLLIGLATPEFAPTLTTGINMSLGLLLYATFLAIPLTDFFSSFKDLRFLTSATVINFAVAPIVAYILTRFILGYPALVLGVLLVLLAPCIDYVIVFTRISGGAHEKLLASTPFLMLLQIASIPLYLGWFTGGAALQSIDPRPFLEAFLYLIVAPLLAAALTQCLSQRFNLLRFVEDAMDFLMVPLMMIVLFLVVGSQIFNVAHSAQEILYAVPIYILFLVIMGPAGSFMAKIFGLPPRERRAIAFTGATRNSLVVLPLAVAMSAQYPLIPAIVVCQTIIEILGMLVYTKAVPKLIPLDPAR